MGLVSGITNHIKEILILNNKKEIWERLHKQKDIWDCLSVYNYTYYFNHNKESIALRNFKSKKLPSYAYDLTIIGRLLTKLCTCSNIMSRRPGSEDVTLYCMLNKPHGSFLTKKLDSKFMQTANPPIKWRRDIIRTRLDSLVYDYAIEKNEDFAFLDIGSGGSFDGLEIDRLMTGLRDSLDSSESVSNYKTVNIDIDDIWLAIGDLLYDKLFGNKSKAISINDSIFSYLEKQRYKNDLSNFDNLIVSCNGFAEFLEDDLLVKLYMDIYDMTRHFDGQIDLILPYAVRSSKQERLGKVIGFNYLAREKNYMLRLCSLIFPGFEVNYEEKHSQIVLLLRRNARK
jgi:hypothetical protein